MDEAAYWINSCSFLIQGVWHMLFVARLTGKKAPLPHIACYLAVLCAVNAAAPSHGAGLVCETLALYGVARLQNGRCVSCVTAILAVYVTMLCYGVINSLAFVSVLYIPYEKLPLVAMQLLVEFTEIVVCAGVYWLLLRFFSLKDAEDSAWMLLPLGFFLPLNEYYMLNSVYGGAVTIPLPYGIREITALLLLQALSAAALFSALYAYRRICQHARTQTVLTALRQEARAQKIYVAEAQARYAQTQAFRHDIRNHLTVLTGLLNTNRINEAKNYMGRLVSVLGELAPSVQTGNPVVDVLLTDKLALAESSGIRTSLSLVLPELCAVDDLDWCILFSNALDNAVHAAARAGGEAAVSVSGKRQGAFYLLEFENTRLEEPLPPWGTGLKNIQAAAEKYHGAITAEAEGKRFRLHVLLDISRPPDGTSWQAACNAGRDVR